MVSVAQPGGRPDLGPYGSDLFRVFPREPAPWDAFVAARPLALLVAVPDKRVRGGYRLEHVACPPDEPRGEVQ
jgi:hypothetical protein